MSLRISVLGGDGMLGTELVSLARSLGHDVRPFCVPSFDIRRYADLESACSGVDLVVNCAAYTAVDKAECEPELCRQVNALPLLHIGEIARRNGARVIHIGTDFVFDGKGERPWREDDEPRPLSVYGLTKLEGERLLLQSGCPCAIIRVQWTYGRHGVNFISKIAQAARSQPCVKVVDDQIGSPTHTADVAKAILSIAETGVDGLFHFAADGYASRYEVAQFIFSRLGISTRLIPCKSGDFKTPADRPLNSRFDCRKISGVLDWSLPHWTGSLGRYLEG